jgi:signal transduction histidine kinase
MMRRLWTAGFVAVVFLSAAALTAGERGTAAEAQALLDKAVAKVKADGSAKALAAFNDAKGGFRDRDLYVFCFGPDKTVTAHADPKRIGNKVSEIMDGDGKAIGTEMLKLADKGEGTVSYRFANPTTGKVEMKQSFIKKAGDQVCGVGAYK